MGKGGTRSHISVLWIMIGKKGQAGKTGGHTKSQTQGSNDGKESFIKQELNKHLGTKVTVECHGGREIVGTLKGFDATLNLALDHSEDSIIGSDEKRHLGLILVRGTSLITIIPCEGYEPIKNPFVNNNAE